MGSLRSIAVAESDVFALTDKGNAELNASGTSLSAAELELLVLLDGKTSVAQLGKAAPDISAADILEAVKKFIASRLVTSATEPSSDGLESGFLTIDVPAGFFSAATPTEHSEADHGASSLKQNGYYVRIARRPAAQREVEEGRKFTVLVVDDDPDVCKLLKTYLTLEGFVPRIAADRPQIVQALRQAPMPDLALLDVALPDTNGFDILVRMREHPALKAIPVIMLTAEATREAVLKGLRAGADGYVTKPFDPEALTMAVKSVLGLGAAPRARRGK